MIIVNELTKKFKMKGKKEYFYAVDNLSFNVNKGEIYGLIGPNGAGKTTTLKMLSTLILPESGYATINGIDVVKKPDLIKDEIGLLSGEFARSLYWRLTGKQNIEFFAKLKNTRNARERIDFLLNLFDLDEFKNELIMKYSTGMKHKLAFAVGLLNDPPVLLLDEPLSGMDPLTSHKIKNLIKTEFKDKTIILASHNLFEIEQLCDRIGLINKGKLQIQGSPEELKENYYDYDVIRIEVDNGEVFSSLKNAEIKEKYVEIKTRDVNKTISEIMKIANNSNVKIKEIKTLHPSLEDIFIKGVGQ
jgi:ABC-2 type transport system ATP-binding protein